MRRFISHRCGIEYVSVEKAACTSIKAALLISDGIEPPSDLWKLHHHPHWNKPVPVRWIFSFVRHPLIRPFSLWWDMVCTGRSNEFVASLPPTTSFPDFIRWIASRTIENRHYVPQSLLLDRAPAGPIAFVGRVEHMASDWRIVQSHACGLGKPPRLNESGRPEDWRQYYDPETLAIAREYYAEDFRRWPGYE